MALNNERSPLVRLGDIVELVTSGATPTVGKKELYSNKDNGVPFFRIQNIGENHLVLSDLKYVTREVHEKELSRSKIRPNDVLVTITGRLGTATVVPKEVKEENINQHLCLVRLKEEVADPEYVSFHINSRQTQAEITQKQHGTTRTALNHKSLSSLEISLPPLKVQKQIASILKKASNLKQKREQANQMANKLLQAVFLQMFGDPLSNGIFKQKKISELTSFVSYGFTRPMPHFATGVPIITSKNVSEGRIDFYNIDYTDEQSFSELSKKDCPIQGDILYTKDGRIGEASAVRTSDKFCISQAVAVLRPLKEVLNPIFFETLLNSKNFRNVVHNMAYGVALKHISITKLKQIPIIVPPMDLQDKLVAIAKKIDEIRLMQEESTNNTNNLFATVMSKAFKGELA
jgi:type I restriction enzyme S subunit